ncbi:hypothetical protein JCM3765_002465 [Sporobolomyces pararoseus]
MSALLLVDVQNDFISGSLAVPSAEQIIPPVLRLLSCPFDLVVASQDYHPHNHVSFASSHPGQTPFRSIKLSHPVTSEQVTQDLWPDHCVQGTEGANFEQRVSQRLKTWSENGKAVVVRKGEDADLDAYSAFAKPLKTLKTEQDGVKFGSPLTKILKGSRIKRLVVAGLATDYCVRASVLSALEEASELPVPDRWEVFVVREAVRGVHSEREEETLNELEKRGAKIVTLESSSVLKADILPLKLTGVKHDPRIVATSSGFRQLARVFCLVFSFGTRAVFRLRDTPWRINDKTGY